MASLMTFTAKGSINGQAVTVVWKEGTISGSPRAVQRVLLEARYLEGEDVGPINQQTQTRHLRSPLSAMVIIDRVLTAAVFTGEIPEPGSVSPGAVI